MFLFLIDICEEQSVNSRKLQFQDMVAAAKILNPPKAATGEYNAALTGGIVPVANEEPNKLIERISNNIQSLANDARSQHLENNYNSDPNHVTRMVTNEFFYY